jgi:hypothetical protein
MGATDTIKWMGRSARSRAQAMGRSMREHTLERRLDRVSDEADRLRFENDRLREEVEQSHAQGDRMLDLLERRLADLTPETQEAQRSHRGRWMVFLMALGGGAYALIRMRSQNGNTEWTSPSGPSDSSGVTKTGAATI